MIFRKALAAPLAILLISGAASAQDTGRNPQIDYPGFRALTIDVESHRNERLLSFARFKAESAREGALILDARSRDAFAAGHIEGAVNLPFTDFTAESLARVIGDPGRPIYIYCNNNFSNDAAPVRLKSVPLALNIQTFINLVGYGFENVWELNEVINFNDPKVGWAKG